MNFVENFQNENFEVFEIFFRSSKVNYKRFRTPKKFSTLNNFQQENFKLKNLIISPIKIPKREIFPLAFFSSII